MKYLVMETHPAYAVVLDEEGRIIKAANLRYQAGDAVESIVELQKPKETPRIFVKPLAGIAAMAACLCLVFFGYYRPNYMAYGTLRIQINPDVEMTISQTERVLNIEGLNEDGEVLVEGLAYHGKSRDTVTDELMGRAIQMGYLSDGDTISVTVKSADGAWQASEEEQVIRHLEERYGERVVIALTSQPQPDGSSDQPQHDDIEVVIPVQPQTPPPETPSQSAAPSIPPPSLNKPERPSNTPTPGGTGDDDTDYGPSNDGITDYEDTDYGLGNDGVTDYGPSNDGVTDYDDDGSNHNDDDNNDDDNNDDDNNDDNDDGSNDDDGDDDSNDDGDDNSDDDGDDNSDDDNDDD